MPLDFTYLIFKMYVNKLKNALYNAEGFFRLKMKLKEILSMKEVFLKDDKKNLIEKQLVCHSHSHVISMASMQVWGNWKQ